MNQTREGTDLFSRPVTALPGVAGRRAALLRRLGITTWFDLLTWFPRDFEDWSMLTPLTELIDGEDQTFVARVVRKPAVTRRGRLSIVRTILRDDAQAVAAVWFNQTWLVDRLKVDQWYIFRGRITRSGATFSVQNPAFEPWDPQKESSYGIRPIYPLTEGLSQGVLRRLIQTVIPRLIGQIPEPLPDRIRRRHKLCAVDFAYSRIHHPSSWEEAEICRRRLAFEELFLLLAGLQLLRSQSRNQDLGCVLTLNPEQTRKFNQIFTGLPFSLTQAQERTWKEVLKDLASPQPMNRLIQGDVGSGKTVIAALSMLWCALAGGQAALMAPTAILARQHFDTLSDLLSASGEPIALLTGSTPAKERRQLLSDLADGQIRLLVGTHALIEESVSFHNLLLAVTDEQHRFGVRQRIKLGSGEAAVQPHVLVMSATPIPRTLALILYSDLDISLIDQLPPGRQPIRTYTAVSGDRPRIEGIMRRQVQAGRQVYVVCPMIEEQAATDLKSAVSTYNRLAQQVFPDFRIGLLHGSLKADVKERVMQSFMQGEVQILVSTTVIEVGVDNPNANLMLIENAERFGLAQLHQLRGRIGRGTHQSLCILLSDSQDEKARERLRILCRSEDGFEIAEKDLELRGPGEFFGTRQHGLPPLKLANLYRDRQLLADVQVSLAELAKRDPLLESPENQPIRRALDTRYGQLFKRIGI
ncbi:MAG: ATP-dependent DNA helicase RecG [Saccharofermentanales bacterium]|jgi:ATP-dependent DNA helicase RecG